MTPGVASQPRCYELKRNALNAPSQRAAKCFGVTFEGVLRQHMIVKGRNRDTARFVMLDGEWTAHRAAFERYLAWDHFDGEGRQMLSVPGLMPAPAQ